MKLSTDQKINKKTAFEIVNESLKNNIPLDSYQTELLLMYFAPALPKKPKTVLQYAALFAGTKLPKKELNYIHVDEKFIVATDTRAMIKIENTNNIDFGYLDKKTQNYIEEMAPYKYPDYLRIFPRDNLMYKVFNTSEHTLESLDNEFYYNIDGAIISKIYIDKMLSYDYKFEYCTQGDNMPVSFKSLGGLVHVVIMPIVL